MPSQDNNDDEDELSPAEIQAATAMFRRFAPKFVPLLFKQYDTWHGKWGQGTEAASAAAAAATAAGAPAPPPMPIGSQVPAGGIGEGGSAERLASLLEAATKCVRAFVRASVRSFCCCSCEYVVKHWFVRRWLVG